MRGAIWNTFFDGPSDVKIETLRCGVQVYYYTWPGVASDTKSPVIIYLHGGGYSAGHPRSYRTFAETLSRCCGMRVCSVNYRLAPEHPLPAAVEDVVMVYEELIQRYGVSPEKIAISGDSAGGGLTLLSLAAIRDADLPLPACGVPISPWADLTNSDESIQIGRDIMFRYPGQVDTLTSFAVGGDMSKCTDPTCSPLATSFQFRDLPPLHVLAGNDEALRDQAIRVASRAREEGVTVILDVVEFMPHIFPVFGTFLPEGAAATSRICDFITSHCAMPQQSVRVSNGLGVDRIRSRL